MLSTGFDELQLPKVKDKKQLMLRIDFSLIFSKKKFKLIIK